MPRITSPFMGEGGVPKSRSGTMSAFPCLFFGHKHAEPEKIEDFLSVAAATNGIGSVPIRELCNFAEVFPMELSAVS
jgi:hypothetical protein